jgi:hypothetical protein
MSLHARAAADSKRVGPIGARYANWIAILPGLLVFCLGAVTQIRVPGVYMDAVNPDYMVVRLLHPHAAVPIWILAGQLLLGRFPVLVQIYHGALPFYVGLPVYVAVGTGLIGIRLANLVFGGLVTASAGLFLRSFGVQPFIAALALVALALDTGFLFSFRTQFYITLLPLALIFASVALVEYRRDHPTPLIAVLAGFCAGLSVYGYFIYCFLLPAVAAHAAWRWHGRVEWRRTLLWWIAGLALGGSPYLLAAVLVFIYAGGLQGFFDVINTSLNTLGVADSSLSLTQRILNFWTTVSWTIRDVGPPDMMLSEVPLILLPLIKTFLLLALPAAGLLASLSARLRSPGLLVAVGLFVGQAVLFIVFGSRLWLHHAAPLLPILYVALALALDQVARVVGPRPGAVAAAVVLSPLLAGNAYDRHSVFALLAQTGGVGLTSDAIERFAQDSVSVHVPTRAFFPDWGVFMPFEMITRGRIPLSTDFSPQEARHTLCSGKDVLLGLTVHPGPDRLPAWISETNWGTPDITIYRQRNDVPELIAVRWHAATQPTGACAGQ